MAMIGSVGNVEIGRIFDSSLLGFTAQSWFPLFDREALRAHEHWLCPDHFDPETGRIPMPVHSWLLRVGGRNVLIDTCMGNDKERPQFPEMHRLQNRYLDRLAAVGLAPADIDYVLCTHLHVDHVGWNTCLENGRWVPTFPNARYIFSKVEYEATKAEALDPAKPAYLRATFEDSIHPVIEAGKVELYDGTYELLDCITLRPAPGHSEGHVRIELRSQDNLGIFCGDMVHSPLQIPLWEWSSVVCWDKAMSAKARHELLQYCVNENALLIPGHFEAPHVGRIREKQGKFSIDFGW
ncbi:MBL fold metallo-hydrolase [Sphingomonas sp. SRS2]|uniref:MBL fold metallo-hydrolase n=1 Tax=Sphingomonas sp. SRS2 TaxID=133190 RepID=UPI0006184920|nr:MBL fold metallo-hydrolase [Sphingomonas sp. SRS2]KKC23921.1 beta-lactamase [Sphingomonas sp. SRS2]